MESVNRILTAAFHKNSVASLEALREVAKTVKDEEASDILGLAHLAMLDLETAAYYFLENGNRAYLQQVFELALRHGKYVLVKFLREKGLPLESSDYTQFLRDKALPYLPLYRDEKRGFSIDERMLDMVIADLRETRKTALTQAVEFMEKMGSRDLVKKFILSHYSGNQELIQRYETDFNNRATGGRADIVKAVEARCGKWGWEFIKTLQTGDSDNYYPSVAGIFLIRENGKRLLVLKEHLRLHQDYSRLNGYSMEKEILEALGRNSDNIVGYLSAVDIDGIEFLVLDFMPGVTLERYVKPDNLLPPQKVIAIIIKLAEAIDYLHQNGIISMDIKDKNVMYNGSEPILFDFGVSQIGGPFIASLLTTPEYTTPEMAMTFKAYPQTDIFQLGVLFYKLLVGRNPFVRYDLYDFAEDEGHRESAIIKFVLPALFLDFDRNPDVLRTSPAVTNLLSAMLEKDYANRPKPKEIVERLKSL